jgi:2-oxoglutarate dehydrogenase E2 component (dihydrolipoamide succinyltransferase)
MRSPAVRRLAREHHLDLSRVPGTGAGGRVTRADVLAFIGTAPAASRPRIVSAPAVAAPGNAVPFSPLRARIAANVLASKRAVADVFSVIEADMESVHAVRAAQREKFTYLPFIARAVVEALRAVPAVNARLDGDALVYNDAVHLGIAVDLDGEGLVVPVVRDADGLTVTGLARAIAKLVATLSTDAVEERVVAYRGGIAIRRRMYLCMSWDHRAFDGSTAAKFIVRIKRELEERDWSAQL